MAFFGRTARSRIKAALAGLVLAAIGYVTAVLTGKGGSGINIINLNLLSEQTINLGQQPKVEREMRSLGYSLRPTRTEVSWYAVEPDCGSITPDGRYTAPAAERTCHIVATSQGKAEAAGKIAVVVVQSKKG